MARGVLVSAADEGSDDSEFVASTVGVSRADFGVDEVQAPSNIPAAVTAETLRMNIVVRTKGDLAAGPARLTAGVAGLR